MAGTTQYFGISYPTATDYVKDGASNMQTIATGFDTAVAIPTYNNQTGTTYTFVLADAAKVTTSNNASAVTFTIPPQSSVAWATGTTLKVNNLGAGAITFAGGVGVTVSNAGTTLSQYAQATLVRTASDAWTVIATAPSNSMTLISTTNLSGASSFTLSSIPQTYKNLVLTVENYANSVQNIYFRPNNDSGTNYVWNNVIAISNSAVADSQMILGYQSDGTTKTAFGTSTLYNYAGSSRKMAVTDTMFVPNGTSNVGYQRWINIWNQTAAVTSIVVYAGSSFTQGTLKLYGVN